MENWIKKFFNKEGEQKENSLERFIEAQEKVYQWHWQK